MNKNLSDVLGFRSDSKEVFPSDNYVIPVPSSLPHYGQEFTYYITPSASINLTIDPVILLPENPPTLPLGLTSGSLYIAQLQFTNKGWTLININGGFINPTLDWYPALGSFASRIGPTPAFSRASGATMVDVNGNVVWGPENLILNSNAIAGSQWLDFAATGSMSSTPSPVLDPWGGTTTAKIVFSGDTQRYQVISGPVGPFIVSCWLRTESGTEKCRIGFYSGVPNQSSDLNVTSVWTRFQFTAVTTAALVNTAIYNASDLGANTILATGFMISKGSTLHPYIPTTSAPVYGPRITYDPISHQCLGYLAEEQRTNYVYPSVPDGTGSGVGNLLLRSLTSAAGGSDGPRGLPYRRYTPTVAADSYIYADSINTLDPENNFSSAWIRRVSGTATQILFGVGSPKENVNIGTGEWVNVGKKNTNGIQAFGIGGNNTWPVDLVLDIAAIQVEQGSFPTSYIPTTTAAATRSADVCQIGGADFLSFYNQSEGTYITEVDAPGDPFEARTFLGPGTGVEAVIRYDGSYRWWDGSHEIYGGVGTDSFLVATAYNASGKALCANGGSVITDLFSIPAQSQLSIGSNGEASTFLNGTIARIQYFNKRLSNQELINLTLP